MLKSLSVVSSVAYSPNDTSNGKYQGCRFQHMSNDQQGKVQHWRKWCPYFESI